MTREPIVRVLVQLRRALGVTQADMARQLGISQATVSEFETGADPRLSTLQRYAGILGATIRISIEPDLTTVDEPPQDDPQNREL